MLAQTQPAEVQYLFDLQMHVPLGHIKSTDVSQSLEPIEHVSLMPSGRTVVSSMDLVLNNLLMNFQKITFWNIDY